MYFPHPTLYAVLSASGLKESVGPAEVSVLPLELPVKPGIVLDSDLLGEVTLQGAV